MTSRKETKRSLLKSLLTMPLGLAGLMAAGSGSRPVYAAGTEDTKTRLQRLEDAQRVTDARQQITEVLHHYARGWDRRDKEALLFCFHPDSTHQHGGFVGKSVDFVNGGLKAVEPVVMMTHIISNISIEIVGDKAVSESYFLAHHRRPVANGEGLEDWFIKGRYLDRFEKRDGLWKIAHRIGLNDFARTFGPADTSLDGSPADQLSARKPDDPLYAMLAQLHGSR